MVVDEDWCEICGGPHEYDLYAEPDQTEGEVPE